MKSFLSIGIIILIISSSFYLKEYNFYTSPKEEEIKNGDIIFQTSLSSQSKAIQLATKSTYSHCGIVFKEGNQLYVFEAIQPVKKTSLYSWIKRGKDQQYVIKRLKNAEEILTPSVLAKMKQIGSSFIGKNYDFTFEWSDDKMYCSELVWKIYQRGAGIEIGEAQKLKDFDLSKEQVKKKLSERFGKNIPFNETVISPSAIFESNALITIYTN